ncbi:diphthine synthase [Candidatus Woesearchaeota archaeon]|jgi:diphthine synthase|nr:diphthine synthase [Candidatus Woesearchaeota archaeon]|tara:strand:+ start:1639 stop:2382 length:744 start_codon:yes stop_codon:yes gene_type:complete
MTLYIIGLGLNNEKDITLKGLEAVKGSDYVYLENYTSALNCSVKDLEKLYGKKIILADRDLIENKAEQTILKDAKSKNVSLLVIGEPLSATTHIDIMLRAKELKIKVNIINNASILTAAGITGLQLYKFGQITSIPFDNKDIKTPVEVLKKNQKAGLHTLFLLDLNPEKKEFLSINKALEYLVRNKVSKETLCIGCAALGSESPEIKAGKIKEVLKAKFKKYPQCLIIPGKLHFMEEDAMEIYSIST